MEKITQDYSSDTLIAEEQSKIILAYKYAEIARNEAAAINKLYGTITLHEYFGLTVLYCKNKQITSRRANKKQDLN